jgi:hypothetical protein
MVFSDEQVLLSSLRLGYYQIRFSSPEKQAPIEKLAQYLALNHERRFWKALSDNMLFARFENAKELLMAFAQHHMRHKCYPKHLGKKLLQLLQSLPPETRRLKIAFPVIPVSALIELSQFATDPDYGDVPLLFKAVTGQIVPFKEETLKRKDSKHNPENDNGAKKLQVVLSEIDEEVLTSIGLPIDAARANYIMESIKAESHDDFLNTITGFYIHLVRHIGKTSEAVDRDAAGPEALALLQRAFAENGGFNNALSKALDGNQGGLRMILDKMTVQFKREEQEKHVNMILKTALDPLKFQDQTFFVSAL